MRRPILDLCALSRSSRAASTSATSTSRFCRDCHMAGDEPGRTPPAGNRTPQTIIRRWVMNRRWATMFLVVVAISVALVSASGRESDEERENSEVRTGLKIAPVALNLENKDIHLVGLGSYVVNAQSS